MAFGTWLQVAATALAPVAVTRGPVVTQPSPAGAVVTWSTSRPTTGTLAVRDGAGTTMRFAAPVGSTSSVRVTGLAPGTRYAYAVDAGGTTLATGSFRTDPGPTGSFSAAAFGDYGDGGTGEAGVARLVTGWRPDVTVSTGDNVYLFAAGGFLLGPNVFTPLRDLFRETAFVPALGNHDTFGDGGAAFLGAFTLGGAERYYVQRYGSAAFVVLDSDAPVDPTSPQGRFLRAAIRDTRDACFRIAVFHHPPFSPHSGPIAGGLRRYVAPLLERAGFQLVLLGHVHSYERTHERATTYVTVGTGGATLGRYADSTLPPDRRIRGRHGALRLTVGPRRLLARFTTSDGRVADRFALTCSPTR
jgi:hypothetical protein